MRARSLPLAVAATLGLALFGANEAHAFRVLFCDDVPVKWEAPFGYMRNACSVPAGSATEDAYLNAIARYNGIAGMENMVFHLGATPSSDCYVEQDDGVNDFATVAASVIDGALGTTFTYRYCEELVEADIWMAGTATQDFNNPDEAFAIGTNPFDSNNTGHFAVIHELGHAHGLSISDSGLPDNHTSGFANMRAAPPTPLVGGLNIAHSRIHADDAAGGRFLYPSGFSETNLEVSAQRHNGSTVVNNAAFGTINKCRGDSVTYNWTTENRGTSAQTSNQRFYIATNPTAHNDSGVHLATWFGATVNAQNVVFPSITATIPCGTAPGLYWVYHKADSSNTVSESSEVDNVTHNPMTIQVQNCGCP